LQFHGTATIEEMRRHSGGAQGVDLDLQVLLGGGAAGVANPDRCAAGLRLDGLDKRSGFPWCAWVGLA
jgi:hypothetical protein